MEIVGVTLPLGHGAIAAARCCPLPLNAITREMDHTTAVETATVQAGSHRQNATASTELSARDFHRQNACFVA